MLELMKTIPILIAILLMGNVVAGEPILDVDKIMACLLHI